MRRQPGLCGITTIVFTFIRIRSPRAIAEELLTLRERQGLTRNALAARSGISRSTLGRLAAGRSVPTIEMLVKLAKLELATSTVTVSGLCVLSTTWKSTDSSSLFRAQTVCTLRPVHLFPAPAGQVA